MTTYAMVLGYAWTHNKVPIFTKHHLTSQPGGQLNYDRIFYKLPQGFPQDAKINPAPAKHVKFYFQVGGVPLQFIRDNVCLCGAVHEYTYFKDFPDRIKAIYSPTQEIIDEIRNKYADLIDHPKTVAVHVRTYHPKSDFHCFLGNEYFSAAMNLFDDDHLFVIFSDRIDWCKKYLNLNGKKAVFIEGNDIITDFYLMSFCKNIIACNSTYSWWAAYLRANEKGRVIAPSRWFYDPHDQEPGLSRAVKKFYPEDWTILPVPKSPDHDWTLLNYETSSLHERW